MLITKRIVDPSTDGLQSITNHATSAKKGEQVRGSTAGILCGALACGFAALVWWMHENQYEVLREWVREDGQVEVLTFIALLAGGVLFLRTAVYDRPDRAGCIFFGLLCLGVAGEEISWGQRLIGYETPAFVSDINEQGEFTLHNLRGVHTSVRLWACLFLMVVAVCIPAYRLFSNRSMHVFCKTPVFPLPATPIILTAFVVMLGQRLWYDEVFRTFDESGELMIAVGMLVFAIVVFLRQPGKLPRSSELSAD